MRALLQPRALAALGLALVVGRYGDSASGLVAANRSIAFFERSLADTGFHGTPE